MDLVLTVFFISVMGVIAALVVFSVAMRDWGEGDSPRPSSDPVRAAERFFFETPLPKSKTFPSQTPKELIALLETHFRWEERAAATFLRGPSIESLHDSPSSSLQK